MVRLLATEATSYRKKAAEIVRAMLEERRLKQEADIQSRKKIGEECRHKARKKRNEDLEAGLQAAVLLVAYLRNEGHRLKVDRNASQLYMNGVMEILNNCNVVVVDGGSKTICKFKIVMTRRIYCYVVDKGNGDTSEG